MCFDDAGYFRVDVVSMKREFAEGKRRGEGKRNRRSGVDNI